MPPLCRTARVSLERSLRLRGQLESFAFGKLEGTLHDDFPGMPRRSFTGRRHLSLCPNLYEPRDLIADALHNIPSTLTTLRVTSIDEVLYSCDYRHLIPVLLEVLRQDLFTLRNLCSRSTVEGRQSEKRSAVE